MKKLIILLPLIFSFTTAFAGEWTKTDAEIQEVISNVSGMAELMVNYQSTTGEEFTEQVSVRNSMPFMKFNKGVGDKVKVKYMTEEPSVVQGISTNGWFMFLIIPLAFLAIFVRRMARRA